MAVASNSWKKQNVRNHFAERGGARGGARGGTRLGLHQRMRLRSEWGRKSGREPDPITVESSVERSQDNCG